jgi:hypothetical protein
MTGKKESNAIWHHTTVVLRSDIYREAVIRGIDISDTCNQALASLTGIEYHQLQLEEVPAPPPVIVARNGSLPQASGDVKKAASPKLHPVINADDPAAPATVVQAKTRPAKKALTDPTAPVPAPESASPEEPAPAAPATPAKKATVQKGRAVPVKKRSRGDALKTFFSTKIVRTEETGAAVDKDELYELFARFCREHRITPVPERKAVTVALKNQFALTETNVNGTPCWNGIRLK